MVESQLEDFSRAATPLAPSLTGEPKSHTQGLGPRGLNFGNPESSRTQNSNTVTSTEYLSEGDNTPPDSMPGDESSQSTPVRNRSRATNRRRPFSTGGVSRQSAGPLPATSTLPPSDPSANLQFQPSFHYPSTPSPFAQRSGFFGQYTLPPQPSSLSIGQVSPYSYSFHPQDGVSASSPPRHPYHHPSPQPYHFPRHHSDDGTNRSAPFSRAPSSSAFGPHQVHTNPGHSSNEGSGGQSYVGSPHFQSMGYSPPPPLSSAQYGYPQQYSGPPTVYQSFGAMHYPHHASSPSEVENQTPQGAWYFVPHNPPSQQHPYENVQFRSGYQYQYQPIGQHPELHRHASPSSAAAPPHQQRPLETQNPPASSPPLTGLGPSSHVGLTSSASSPALSAKSKPITRREWHPRPPPHRSPWVMWVGNVPSDASQEELWKFFTQIPGPSGGTADSGVESIHLISRSNCAFINYGSEAAVNCAIQTVNGMRLRPNDPQCPMLVCKIRRSMDDLQSGVGGQRGMGLHRQWIREQRGLKAQSGDSSDFEARNDLGPDRLADVLGSVSISPDERGRRGTHTSSSSSHASTTSSLLAEYFPTRYFILKSLSEDDLNLSVENGLWATQSHNELLLDQAFRTARDVYLIFSVNKSGEFYGYAKMIGPIRQGEGTVSWALRSDGSPSSVMLRRNSSCGIQDSPRPPMYFTPDGGHLVDSSPLRVDGVSPPIPPTPRVEYHNQSAPPKFGGPPPQEPSNPPSLRLSLDFYQRARAQTDFELDESAPIRAMHQDPPPPGMKGKSRQGSSDPLDDYQDHAEKRPSEAQWGECFKVEWLERRKIPFHRTRHLRNPWNKGREIKISRDGTELEPSVGANLLEEWGSLSEAQQTES